MWSFLLLCSCMHIAVVVAHTPIFGHRGERLHIRCPYKSGYESNPKYFCKGECKFGNKNIVVKSGSPAKEERFSLTDDKRSRVFTVSITDLRTTDQGQYWCGVKRILTTDVYTEILLLVKQDERLTEFPTISLFLITSTRGSSAPLTPQTLLAQTSAPNSDSFVIIIITAGGLVLLLISAVLLVVAVRKKKQTCGLVSFFTEELHVMTRKAEENAYGKGNPAVVSHSHTAQSDDGSAANVFHRPANTETVDTDLDYMNVAAAVRNGVDPDQIYTELNASRQSDVYQSLRTDSVQEESIYHNIDQTPEH
uniref:Immunoglobulin V-set domain-containing protein n=1 Tax=Cyprinus carpio TaxID=7962 RepID=A0A8C1L6F6_CYPCA